MNRNIRYLVLCLFASLCYAGYTAAAQDCKISVINNDASGDGVIVAVFNGDDPPNSAPLQDTELAYGKTWHTRCDGGTENKCKILWTSINVIERALVKDYLSHKSFDVTCETIYEITIGSTSPGKAN